MSPTLVSSAALVAAVGTLVAMGPATASRLLEFARRGYALASPPRALLDDAWSVLGWSVGPPLVAAFAAALVAGLAQTQGTITLGPLAPTALRRRPTDGALRALLLGATAALATALAFHLESEAARRVVEQGGQGALAATVAALGRVGLRVGAVMAAAGLVDLVARRALLERSLWMTRAEAEREHREEAGDPRVAAERRQRGQRVGASRLAEQVAASLVVLASEGVAAAIAIHGDGDGDGERVLVAAAGERLVAARIVDLARRLGTPVRGDDFLAPRLAALSAGDAVPPPFVAKVREIIAAAQRRR